MLFEKSILLGDSSSIQINQTMNKEGDDWLLDDELNNFEGWYVCYISIYVWLDQQ
jgi:hypothetical protein